MDNLVPLRFGIQRHPLQKFMKTAGLQSINRRTILPVSTVEQNRKSQSRASEVSLTLGNARKAFATGTNLAPQPAIETLFRGKRGGRPTGLEPATARTTIWSSTIELRPPVRTKAAGRRNFAEIQPKFSRRQFKDICVPVLRRAGAVHGTFF